ncbi:hypothetical protein O7635_06335 [Asanoa sp. WMMD1127]|uniref:hypothetical protein n=1 Tax=Asanoa sp. WMMD1127 TaxID=3016107 RepID=UPI002416B1FB|nr:hypothetical protein [Asanoa sp. WMMD1127]MDG4821473.1 hypothetical protein [Asanoa sp. WMMD1127]
MAGERTAWRRNLVGSLAVVAGVLALSLGVPAIDDALPNATVSSTEPLEFATDASVVPPPDATVVAEQTSPDQGVVTMAVDGVRYRLTAESFPGTLQQLADRIRAEVRNIAGIQAVSDDQSVTSDSGIPGLQATFVAENRTGWYTVYLRAGTAVTAVVDGNDAGVTEHREELETSVRTVTIEVTA